MARSQRILIDTLEYVNTRNTSVRIDLWFDGRLYNVHVTIGNHQTVRSFYTEHAANNHIAQLQRI